MEIHARPSQKSIEAKAQLSKLSEGKLEDKNVKVPVFQKPSWVQNLGSIFGFFSKETHTSSYQKTLGEWITKNFTKEEGQWLTNKVKENLGKNIQNFINLSKIKDTKIRQNTMKGAIALEFVKAKSEYYNKLEEDLHVKDQLKQALEQNNNLYEAVEINILADAFGLNEANLSQKLQAKLNDPYSKLEPNLKDELQDEILLAIYDNNNIKSRILNQLDEIQKNPQAEQTYKKNIKTIVSTVIDKNLTRITGYNQNVEAFTKHVNKLHSQYESIGCKNLPTQETILGSTTKRLLPESEIGTTKNATTCIKEYDEKLKEALKANQKILNDKLTDLDREVKDRYGEDPSYAQFESKLTKSNTFIENCIKNLDDFEQKLTKERGKDAFFKEKFGSDENYLSVKNQFTENLDAPNNEHAAAKISTLASIFGFDKQKVSEELQAKWSTSYQGLDNSLKEELKDAIIMATYNNPSNTKDNISNDIKSNFSLIAAYNSTDFAAHIEKRLQQYGSIGCTLPAKEDVLKDPQLKNQPLEKLYDEALRTALSNNKLNQTVLQKRLEKLNQELSNKFSANEHYTQFIESTSDARAKFIENCIENLSDFDSEYAEKLGGKTFTAFYIKQGEQTASSQVEKIASEVESLQKNVLGYEEILGKTLFDKSVTAFYTQNVQYGLSRGANPLASLQKNLEHTKLPGLTSFKRVEDLRFLRKELMALNNFLKKSSQKV